MIRKVCTADAAEVADIYNYFVRDTIVTFEEQEMTTAEMQRRITMVACRYPWLVAESDGEIAGFAYVNQWKSRSSYRYTLETSIYLATSHLGKGLGSRLFAELLKEVRNTGKYHTLIGVIALPNPASVALHEKFGFKKAAHFVEVGYKFGRFIDVGYWHLLI